MSYAINVRGATKEEVVAKVKEKFDEVLEQQPVHEQDCDEAQRTVAEVLSIMPDTIAEDREYAVAVNGSLTWENGDDTNITGAGLGVYISIAPKL